MASAIPDVCLLDESTSIPQEQGVQEFRPPECPEVADVVIGAESWSLEVAVDLILSVCRSTLKSVYYELGREVLQSTFLKLLEVRQVNPEMTIGNWKGYVRK